MNIYKIKSVNELAKELSEILADKNNAQKYIIGNDGIILKITKTLRFPIIGISSEGYFLGHSIQGGLINIDIHKDLKDLLLKRFEENFSEGDLKSKEYLKLVDTINIIETNYLNRLNPDDYENAFDDYQNEQDMNDDIIEK